MTQERIDVIFTSTGARQVRRNIDDIGKTSKTSHSAVGLLRRGIQLLAGAFIIRQLVRLTDEFTNLQNRLRVVTNGMDELNFVQRELLSISNRTRSSLATNAELYTRLTLATKELNIPLRERLAVTESINQAVILSGASSQEASAGLIQLSQGLASGALRGDELRSVLEQLPVISDIIAKELGVTRGELRGLGEDGKITADIIIRSFRNARDELNEQFSKTVPTLSQAWTVLGSNVLFAVGRLNEARGTTRGLAGFIGDIGIAIGNSADKFVAFGNVTVRVLSDLFSGLLGIPSILTAMGVDVKAAFSIILQTAAKTVEDLIGFWRGYAAATIVIFTNLGPGLKAIFINIFNGLIDVAENSLNAIADGINNITGLVKLPKLDGVDLSDFKKTAPIELGAIGAAAGKAFSDAFNDPTRVTFSSLIEDYKRELAAIQENFNGKAPGGGGGNFGSGESVSIFGRIREEVKSLNGDLTDLSANIQDTIGGAFQSAEDTLVTFFTTGKASVKDFVNSVLEDLARLAIRQAILGPLSQGLGSLLGGFGGGAAAAPQTASSVVPVPAFATGGSFQVGGSGGVDSQMVRFRATPGEMVNITKPGQGPKVEVNVINNTSAQATVTESQTPAGGRSIDVVIDEVVAQKVGNHGSKTSRALRQTFGVNQLTQGR